MVLLLPLRLYSPPPPKLIYSFFLTEMAKGPRKHRILSMIFPSLESEKIGQWFGLEGM